MRPKPRKYENDHWSGFRSSGSQVGTLGGVAKFASWLFRAGRSAHIWLETQETNRRIDAGETSGMLEDGRLGTLEDAKKLGLLEPGGFHLGFLDGHELSLKDDWHICTFGPAGFLKSSTVSYVNAIKLLRGAPDGYHQESWVGLDWKNNEFTRAVRRGVKEVTGQDALVFAPYDPKNKVTFSPLQDVIDKAQRGETIADDVRARLSPYFTDKIAKAGQNAWIDKEAYLTSQIVTAARAHLDPEAATLGGLWDFAQASISTIMNFMEVAAEHDDISGGFVSASAIGFLNRYGSTDNERELRWVLQSINESFSLFAPGSVLRTATETTNVEISELKKKPGALIVSIPDQHTVTASPFVLATLEAIVEKVALTDGPHRVNIIAEEFSALPYSKAVLKWVRLYRALGIRMVSVVQDRSGFAHYKPDGAHKPFEENSVKIYCGLSDAEHMRYLEQRAGKKTVLVATRSTSLGVRIPGGTHGASEMLTPVLPISDIARIGPREALIDIPGQPLFLVDRVPWWEQSEISHLIDDTRFNRP